MTRTTALAIAIGSLTFAGPVAVAQAQVHVDVGVWTPSGGGHVVVGPAPVYRAPRPRYPVLAPVYVSPAPIYRRDRGRHMGWAKKARAVPAPYGWYAADGRDYRRDIARAEAEYRRNLQRAEREYYEDVRDAGYRRGHRR